MIMDKAGPSLEHLLHRIAGVPSEFSAEPLIASKGEVHVPAVVRDLFAMRGLHLDIATLSVFAGRDAKTDRNRLSIALLMCWVLSDREIPVAPEGSELMLGLLRDDAGQLATYTNVNKLSQDAERREELARLILARLGLRPAGETAAQAQDRFTSISSIERARILKASQQAEQRARALREALAKKAAEESADKWTRE
jgi:hypothetical protein